MIRNKLVCDFNRVYGNGNNMASFIGRTVARHSGDLASFYAANVEAADKVLNDVVESVGKVY